MPKSCTASTPARSLAPGTDGLPTYYYHRFAAAGNRDNYTTSNNADLWWASRAS
ncbi:hypothetical protein H1235_04465 [Pseudoxanthomonas sp. NC8]|nr:hypothetical protein H1235_04465 [Pseudoxanthomonas sp. NC8]